MYLSTENGNSDDLDTSSGEGAKTDTIVSSKACTPDHHRSRNGLRTNVPAGIRHGLIMTLPHSRYGHGPCSVSSRRCQNSKHIFVHDVRIISHTLRIAGRLRNSIISPQQLDPFDLTHALNRGQVPIDTMPMWPVHLPGPRGKSYQPTMRRRLCTQ